jgi:hypothetical protein
MLIVVGDQYRRKVTSEVFTVKYVARNLGSTGVWLVGEGGANVTVSPSTLALNFESIKGGIGSDMNEDLITCKCGQHVMRGKYFVAVSIIEEAYRMNVVWDHGYAAGVEGTSRIMNGVPAWLS